MIGRIGKQAAFHSGVGKHETGQIKPFALLNVKEIAAERTVGDGYIRQQIIGKPRILTEQPPGIADSGNRDLRGFAAGTFFSGIRIIRNTAVFRTFRTFRAFRTARIFFRALFRDHRKGHVSVAIQIHQITGTGHRCSIEGKIRQRSTAFSLFSAFSIKRRCHIQIDRSSVRGTVSSKGHIKCGDGIAGVVNTAAETICGNGCRGDDLAVFPHFSRTDQTVSDLHFTQRQIHIFRINIRALPAGKTAVGNGHTGNRHCDRFRCTVFQCLHNVEKTVRDISIFAADMTDPGA